MRIITGMYKKFFFTIVFLLSVLILVPSGPVHGESLKVAPAAKIKGVKSLADTRKAGKSSFEKRKYASKKFRSQKRMHKKDRRKRRMKERRKRESYRKWILKKSSFEERYRDSKKSK